MKKQLSLIISLFVLSCAFGQAPLAFKYQTRAKDAQGNNIINQLVSFRMSILQGSMSGPALYVETDTATTTTFGLANLNIGGGTVVSGSMSSINWSNGPYFIKIEFDPAGGNNFTLMGISQLLSVPYALYSQSAASLDVKTPGQGIILTSPNGNCWQVTVDNTGALTVTSVTCP